MTSRDVWFSAPQLIDIITSPVAVIFTFLLWWGNCSVIYDETYSVIYSVIDDEIMQKSRASLERFWDLKINKINM